jgi:PAS domain S-box-containing protein
MSNAEILVVEDEPIVARHIGMELNALGYSVCGVATCGADALRLAAAKHPDLVLMDIVLKGELDGVETARRLREQMDVPVVYLTAHADESMLKRATATGPSGYLLKPYEERELHTTIHIALHNHKMTRMLKETQQWLGSTLNCLADGVIITDARGRVTLVNPVAAELTGWSNDEARGTSWTRVLPLVDEELQVTRNELAAKALRSGAPVALGASCVLLTRNGRELHVEGTITAVYDAEQNFTGWVILFRDVSGRRRTEQLLGHFEEQLRRWERGESVSRLAAGMAHDFNHLLTGMLGNLAAVLADVADDDPKRDCLVQVEKAALRALEVVKQLVEFTRRDKRRWQPVPLNAVAEGVIDALCGLLDPRTALRFTPAEDLWVVQGDRAYLEEVLLTLCLHARDALPDGGEILLQTENVVLGQGNDHRPRGRRHEYVCVRVCHTGQRVLAEPPAAPQGPEKTLGLAWALVNAIIDRHGGWIDCRSEPGQGTRFEVYLPRHTHQSHPPDETPRAGTPQGQAEEAPAEAAPPCRNGTKEAQGRTDPATG